MSFLDGLDVPMWAARIVYALICLALLRFIIFGT